jgi:serine protease inhibitor
MPQAIVLSTLLLVLAGCGHTPDSQPPPVTPTRNETTTATPDEPAAPPEPLAEPAPPPMPAADAHSVAEAGNGFFARLWTRLRSRPGNLAVSPGSLWMALAMTQAGARGETATQMAGVLGGPSATLDRLAAAQLAQWNAAHSEYTLGVANRLYGERTYTFEAPYLALTREQYRAPLEPVDFKRAFEAARASINGWVAQQTHDRIRNLLPSGSLNGESRLVLVNAVYFLGKWMTPFESSATSDEPFFRTASNSVPAHMMHETGFYTYGEATGVQLLQIPYEGGDFAMTFVLPRERAGLGAVEQRLDAATLASWTSALADRRVEVTLPKFTIDPAEPLSLGDDLKALGMSLPFDPDHSDFTAMANPPSPDDRLYVSRVFHKAFVKVDEQGTEAAAASAVTMMRAGAAPNPEPPPVFHADHPFLFLLRDLRTGLVLFAGRVADPR